MKTPNPDPDPDPDPDPEPDPEPDPDPDPDPNQASRRPRRRSKTSPDLLRSLDGMEPLGTSPQSAAVEARPSTGRNRAGDLASLLDNALLGGVGAPGAVHTGTNGAPRAEVLLFTTCP